MKIIDTFLFSEEFESDLLLVKFHLEDDHVHEWVLIENSYSFQGEYKGLQAEKTLSKSCFKKFRPKIKIVSLDENINPGNNNEGTNFGRENWQRSVVRDYLISNYSDNDRFMISDTDESLDFSDKNRADRIHQILNSHQQTIYIGRMRYWFDFDNRCFLPNIRIPIVPIWQLRNNPQVMMARHYNGIEYPAGEDPLAFEYSYCFRHMKDVWRKKCTYSHTGFTEESVKVALECNHWPRSELRGERVGQEQFDFFEKVKLDERNSPKYVRDNLGFLKTNIVSEKYRENRKKLYGI